MAPSEIYKDIVQWKNSLVANETHLYNNILKVFL